MVSIVDSGATVSVVHPSTGKAYNIQDSKGSLEGQSYEIANGVRIPNLGEKVMAVMTEEGSVRPYCSQVADVSHSLQAVRAMLKSQHIVVFDEDASFAYNKETGEVNTIKDDGCNYTMEHWIIPPDQLGAVMAALDFPRQD